MPKAVSPVIRRFEHREVVYAKDQLNYRPLPVLRGPGQQCSMSRWQLTDEEREAVAAGADVFLMQRNFGELYQPICLQIGECDQSTREKLITLEMPSNEIQEWEKDHD